MTKSPSSENLKRDIQPIPDLVREALGESGPTDRHPERPA